MNFFFVPAALVFQILELLLFVLWLATLTIVAAVVDAEGAAAVAKEPHVEVEVHVLSVEDLERLHLVLTPHFSRSLLAQIQELQRHCEIVCVRTEEVVACGEAKSNNLHETANLGHDVNNFNACPAIQGRLVGQMEREQLQHIRFVTVRKLVVGYHILQTTHIVHFDKLLGASTKTRIEWVVAELELVQAEHVFVAGEFLGVHFAIANGVELF